MGIKQLGLVFAGLCFAIFFMAKGNAERDEAAPGLLTAFMEASDRVAINAAGLGNGSAGPGAAMMPDGTLVPVKAAFTKYRAAGKADTPSEVQHLEPFESCAPAPAPGSAVYALASGEARAQTALYPVDKSDLDGEVKRLGSYLPGNARPAQSGNARHLGMSVFDVAVTDTAQPLTLVLNSWLL